MTTNPKLITRQPKRLFAFGCSFTGYEWPTWPNIIAYDLNIPFYNYGRSGAGNQFIFNTLLQADTKYQFNEDDLVMVSWTNVSREDRHRNNQWVTPGNIYTQPVYDEKYLQEWVCPVGYTVRDFAFIKAAWELLDKRNCQFHFLKMIDFDMKNQWVPTEMVESAKHIENFYEFYLSKIRPSFYQVLWKNDLQSKFNAEHELYNGKFSDGHPSIKEHLLYLERVFDHRFNEKTQQQIDLSNEQMKNSILDAISKGKPRETIPFNSFFFNHTEPISHF